MTTGNIAAGGAFHYRHQCLPIGVSTIFSKVTSLFTAS